MPFFSCQLIAQKDLHLNKTTINSFQIKGLTEARARGLVATIFYLKVPAAWFSGSTNHLNVQKIFKVSKTYPIQASQIEVSEQEVTFGVNTILVYLHHPDKKFSIQQTNPKQISNLHYSRYSRIGRIFNRKINQNKGIDFNQKK